MKVCTAKAWPNDPFAFKSFSIGVRKFTTGVTGL